MSRRLPQTSNPDLEAPMFSLDDDSDYLCPACHELRESPSAYCDACGFSHDPAADADPAGANPRHRRVRLQGRRPLLVRVGPLLERWDAQDFAGLGEHGLRALARHFCRVGQFEQAVSADYVRVTG